MTASLENYKNHFANKYISEQYIATLSKGKNEPLTLYGIGGLFMQSSALLTQWQIVKEGYCDINHIWAAIPQSSPQHSHTMRSELNRK